MGHVHRLLIGNLEGVVQDGLAEVARDVVVTDAFRNRVVPGGKTKKAPRNKMVGG